MLIDGLEAHDTTTPLLLASIRVLKGIKNLGKLHQEGTKIIIIIIMIILIKRQFLPYQIGKASLQLIKTCSIFFVDISNGESGSSLLVDQGAKACLAFDDAVRDIEFAAERRQPDNLVTGKVIQTKR